MSLLICMLTKSTISKQGIVKSKYQTIFNTAYGDQGGRNFVQVHINITEKKVELLSINNGKEFSCK